MTGGSVVLINLKTTQHLIDDYYCKYSSKRQLVLHDTMYKDNSFAKVFDRQKVGGKTVTLQ